MSDDDFYDNGIPVDRENLVVFEFPELSLVFDPYAQDAWAEFNDTDSIELSFSGSVPSDDLLKSLPHITQIETGEKVPIDRALYDLMLSIAASEISPSTSV